MSGAGFFCIAFGTWCRFWVWLDSTGGIAERTAGCYFGIGLWQNCTYNCTASADDTEPQCRSIDSDINKQTHEFHVAQTLAVIGSIAALFGYIWLTFS